MAENYFLAFLIMIIPLINHKPSHCLSLSRHSFLNLLINCFNNLENLFDLSIQMVIIIITFSNKIINN